MIDTAVKQQYKATIGIECHVQLKTRTKLFSAINNDAREADPNTLISHIDLGMPGALPVLNEKAVELGMRAAFALGTEPQRFSKFDRKHYFYPDLPMGYQITQFYDPIIKDGEVFITVGGEQKRVGIHEAHLEADAGKSIHPAGKDYSLVDLNRAGTPLLEIVSEPDMHSAEEAKVYAKELYLRMRYADVSDANMYYGNMRFDVNVSVSKTSELGTRTETKNLNSFRSVERAIEYEIDRQIELLEKGERIIQETRGWDDAKQKTHSLRSKEEAHDYRYMPDPDIPPIVLSEEMVNSVKEAMPAMPNEWREKLSGIGLDIEQIEALLDAEVEFENISFLPLIEQNLKNEDLVQFLANWYINVFIPLLKEHEFKPGNNAHIKLEVEIYELLKANKLNSTKAKMLFIDLANKKTLPENIEKFAAENGYIQVSDEGAVAEIVAKVIAENPKAAEDVKNGEMKAIGFLVGQVMKASRGKANPGLAQELIKKQLGI